MTQPALETARLRVMADGGTIGEQLVVQGVITDEALTEFYRSRLLVPQVNPNTLAKLPPKVVATVPADMAVELRAVPIALDSDNNLTVAMSDPSDRHAVDEIAFFTGAYVVRAVATQMQIAWCLAHYYGHVTALGERLLREEPTDPAGKEPGAPTRKRGITEQVKALRTKRLERGAVMASDVMTELGASKAAVVAKVAVVKKPVGVAKPAAVEKPADVDTDKPAVVEITADEPPVTAAAEPTKIQPVVSNDDAATPVETPIGRLGTASGEIGARQPRAQSIKPPYPGIDDSGPIVTIEAGEPSGPVITIEAREPSGPVITVEVGEDTAPKKPVPKRKRPAEPDPPELAARAGEVQLATGRMKAIDFDVLPSIMISDELERALRPSVSGELQVRDHREGKPTPMPSVISVELQGADSGPAIIRDQVLNEKSEPVLLERRRPSEAPTNVSLTAAPDSEIDPDDEVSDVIQLETRKPLSKRIDKITQVGIGAHPAATSLRMSTGAIAGEVDDSPTDANRVVDDASRMVEDPTRVDAIAAPRADDDTSSSDEHLAAPPSPYGTRDTLQVPVVPPPGPSGAVPPPSGAVSFDNVQQGRPSDEDDEDDVTTKPTAVMSAVELDDVIPGRLSDPLLASAKKSEPGDDGWGPPGTTIPPGLLGAIPGAVLEPASGAIPMPDMDSAPLMVAPPLPPQAKNRPHTVSEQGVARVLEESTLRVLELIRVLEHATERDQVIAVMIAHLAESHERAGFYAARSGELSLFAITPRIPAMPVATLRLDRPSTLQDVVGTRLPYRGPLLDDTSRTFMQATLGATPAELLLVPIAVRERVVGVLFGDHRLRHTFDEQLALAARAAGMALERILKARRA